MPLEVKDLGIDKLREQLAKLGRTRVTFGYQGPSGQAKHPAKGATYSVAQIAAMHEFGVGPYGGAVNFPGRPLLRHTAEENRDNFREAAKKAISDVIDGRATPEVATEAVGELAVAALRRTISRSREWAEPNAASTVRAKGHDQPLVGEEQSLTLSASWAVRVDDAIVKQGGEE